jgi:uncharacterized membrane protein YeaQ/YmgE (transglycosylase-associated protein family)
LSLRGVPHRKWVSIFRRRGCAVCGQLATAGSLPKQIADRAKICSTTNKTRRPAVLTLKRRRNMGIESLIILLFVGAVAGWLAGQIVSGGGFGLIGNIVVGIVGAVVAGYLLPAVGLTMGGGIMASILHATIGAVVLLFLIRLVKRA